MVKMVMAQVVELCLGGPGLNPRIDLGFIQFRIAFNL